MIPEVITLRPMRKGQALTDGVHLYWRDGNRVRWSLLEWPDDGIGSRTHGAAIDLLWAIEDAWSEKIKRDEFKESEHERER